MTRLSGIRMARLRIHADLRLDSSLYFQSSAFVMRITALLIGGLIIANAHITIALYSSVSFLYYLGLFSFLLYISKCDIYNFVKEKILLLTISLIVAGCAIYMENNGTDLIYLISISMIYGLSFIYLSWNYIKDLYQRFNIKKLL